METDKSTSSTVNESNPTSRPGTHSRRPPTTAQSRWKVLDRRGEAQHLARVKLEAARCGRMRAKGRGALRGIEPGRTFKLTDHPFAEANGKYLVLNCRIDIRGMQGLSSKFDGRAVEYEFDTQFELHPTREPYRMPQVTPRPRIDGYEHAVIVGWKQIPMAIDAYNRVLIQGALDREGNHHGNTSIWVRNRWPHVGPVTPCTDCTLSRAAIVRCAGCGHACRNGAGGKHYASDASCTSTATYRWRTKGCRECACCVR
ncbi:contractile injection system protein, VgrG/Pvc8 family [Paraburkholderia sp. A1RI-2L]|uniref:contractile injection system protein, VgrG/Pvc8 family n=1 Tax=Paraburkholderia sp. A1RI-2L TaxID=3028367 RepID=UPI003B9F1961